MRDGDDRRGVWGRRDLLRILGTGAAAAALPRVAVPAATGQMQENSAGAAAPSGAAQGGETHRVDVVIVGAGFAGSARAVTKAGKRVVVLEARNRVGGRVKAGTIAGRKVDVGGMWAAATQTRVLELIKEFGCELVPQFEAGDRLRGSGLAFGSVESRVLYGFAGAGDFVERGGGDSEAALKVEREEKAAESD